ncbi:MAG: hypothetical protein M1814_001367 [Vezdaea aestivalis]|nr:MAG: hypothetical protein M1814_001367 [Vezdaea aestivalis]
MPPPPLEAASLSDIHALAAQPPAQPRTQATHTRDPLTLYIARVPGSKDVFLSTLKPRDKIVSALDVASSLYYFHCYTDHVPEDHAVQQSESLLPEPSQGDRPSVHRKLIPGAKGTANLELPPRRPVGPRQYPLRQFETNLPQPSVDESTVQSSEARTSTPNIAPTLDPMKARPGFLDKANPSVKQTIFSIVRRDPCAESQSNVGSITFLSDQPSNNGKRLSQVGMDPIDLEIDTAGYDIYHNSDSFKSCIRHQSKSKAVSNLSPDSAYGGFEKARESSKSNRLTFHSPWKGTCEFITGISGRSLKCIHSLEDDATAPGPRTASELRLSFPGSSLFGSLGSARSKTPESQPKQSSIHESLRSHLHLSHRSRSGSESGQHSTNDTHSAHDVDRMDLSLGQEAAGGGLSGKNAKLGKLIVEEEGLDMLDLVVTANVAVFIKIYEMRCH